MGMLPFLILAAAQKRQKEEGREEERGKGREEK